MCLGSSDEAYDIVYASSLAGSCNKFIVQIWDFRYEKEVFKSKIVVKFLTIKSKDCKMYVTMQPLRSGYPAEVLIPICKKQIDFIQCLALFLILDKILVYYF